jgi:hypothetical protein
MNLITLTATSQFSYIFNGQNRLLVQGSTTRFDLSIAAQKQEFCYLTAPNSPYLAYISIQVPASQLQKASECFTTTPPVTPPITPPPSGGGTTSTSVIPVLSGDVYSTGLNNAVYIKPEVIDDSNIAPNAAINVAKLNVNPLDRQHHFGQQSVDTISGIDAYVKGISLNEFSTLSSDLSLQGRRITDLGNPLYDSDAVTKSYAIALLSNVNIDDLSAPTEPFNFNYQLGRNVADPISDKDVANKLYVDNKFYENVAKAEVRVVSTNNVIDLVGAGQLIDGVTLAANDRVLLTGQIDARMNGIWMVQNGTWIRGKDASRSEHFSPGLIVFVKEGNTWEGSGWRLDSRLPIVLGVSALEFTPFTGLAGVNMGNAIEYNPLSNTLNVKYDGTTIQTSDDKLTLSPTYPGQNTITVLGTIRSGSWESNVIGVPYGGTGANTPSAARANLNAAQCGVNNDITALNALVDPLSISQGGTGGGTAQEARANLQVAESINGVCSSITHLPNYVGPWGINQGGTGGTTSEQARFNLAAAKAGDNFDITSLNSLITPISISQGGTGANNITNARLNLQAAKSGTNADITQITGLTTALTITQGGTGANNAPAALLNLAGIGTVTNVGTGAQLYKAKTGTAVSLRSIRALPGVTVTVVGDDIVVGPDITVGAGLALNVVGNSLEISLL